MLILKSPYPDSTGGGGGPSPPPGSPLAWWTARSLSQSDGSAVPSLADSSGHGWTAAQSDSSKRPLYYSTAGPNSTPTLRYAGNSSAVLVTSDIGGALGTAHTLAVVCKRTGASAGGDDSPLAGGGGNAALYQSGSSLFYIAGGTSVGVTTPLAVNTPVYVTLWRSGTLIRFYANGTQVGSDLTLGANNALVQMGIGGFPDIASFSFSGEIAEVICYASALSGSELTALHSYITGLYGL